MLNKSKFNSKKTEWFNWTFSLKLNQKFKTLYRSAVCQFLFRWIYYCLSSKSTGKKTGKTYLCALIGLFTIK